MGGFYMSILRRAVQSVYRPFWALSGLSVFLYSGALCKGQLNIFLCLAGRVV